MNIDPNRKYNRPKDGGSFDVPYRSLVPKNVEGMLITGKLMSCNEDFKRDLLPDNIATGQAAGVAAALCAKKGITPREMEKDVKELQEMTIEELETFLDVGRKELEKMQNLIDAWEKELRSKSQMKDLT